MYTHSWFALLYNRKLQRIVKQLCFCCHLVTKLCPTLCDPMNCSPLGSSVHGISQARRLEWVAISFSGWSSQPWNQTHAFCRAGRFFSTESTGKPQATVLQYFVLSCFNKMIEMKLRAEGWAEYQLYFFFFIQEVPLFHLLPEYQL